MLTLGDEIADVLPELREMAESLMLDTCTVGTPTGAITNTTTGVVTVTYTNVYGPAITPLPGKRAGMCKVQSTTTAEANPTVGGATFTVLRGGVHFPVGAFTPAVGQVVALTSVALDPLLVGRVFRVVSLLHKSQATAYRLGVEEVV